MRRHHNKKRAEGFIPNQNGQDNPNANSSSSTSAAPAPTTTTTTTPSPSPTPVRTSTTTTTTTTTTPAQSTTSSSQLTTTSSTTTLVTTSSSSTPVTTSTTLALVVPSTTALVNQVPTTATNLITRSVATPTIGTATFSSAASASSTAASSDSGPQIGPLIGAIGGGLIGVVALAAVAGYFFRRAFRKNDEFDRSEFVRNSVAINDDWTEKPPMGTQNALALARANNHMDEPSATPRPPSMVERRGQGQQSYGVGEVMNNGYHGQQDQYYNYGNNGYYGHDQYAAGYDQQYAAAGGAYGYTPPNEYQQSQLTRKPSAPMVAARGPESEYQQQQQGHDHVASPAEDYPAASQYDARQSVTPYQQQQYNEINKVLNGGTTPTATTPAGGRELSTAYSTLNQPQQPAQGQQQPAAAAAVAPAAHQPAANNRKSVFDDEEDAYGGI